MKKSKVLERILKDKAFMKNEAKCLREDYIDELYGSNQKELDKLILADKDFLSDQEESLRERYVEYLEDNAPDLKPTAKSRTNYVGIEIECFSRYDHFQVVEKLMELGLDKKVQVGSDGSIEPDFGQDLEIRVLLPEKKLHEGLKKLSKLFVKDQFGVNESCGLHIHLDMRNRDVDECYKKLLKFQDMLFGMVKTNRWDNDYCYYTKPATHQFEKYVAINRSAYKYHKTIEVRLHHATLEVDRIEKWINLLLRMIKTTPPPTIQNKADVLKWVKGQKAIEAYVKQNFNEKWFNTRKKIVGEQEGF